MFRNILLSAFILSAGPAAAVGPASAGTAEARTALVHTADLNLTNEAGRAALHQRVNGAINQVCEVSGWGFALAAKRAYEDCSSKARATAAHQIDALEQAAATRQFAASPDLTVSVQ